MSVPDHQLRKYLPSNLLIGILLVLSLATNLLLSRNLVKFQGERERLQRTVQRLAAQGQLQAGDAAPPIEAVLVDGKSVMIDFSSGSQLPTMLYYFSPDCIWCERNTANIRSLAAVLQGRYRLLGLAIQREGLKAYAESRGFEFPILTDISPASVDAYHLGGTPRTFLVSRDGKVLKNWVGAYSGALQKEVENSLGLQIPGLSEPATPDSANP